MRHVHFIGIGGVGMNGLAQLAAQSGYRVSGSDRAYSSDAWIFQCLKKAGIELFAQDGSGITSETDAVVYSTAIESDNPDLQQAAARNLPRLHRSEFLKELVGDRELIAVAGTAGKTTTTGMLGWIFESLGFDPSVYSGAAILNWKKFPVPGNIRKGNSDLWIIEADESDKSFLNFHPAHSIITNISRDHYELDELNAMFNQFEAQTAGTTLRGSGKRIPVPTLGKHDEENAATALELCVKLGLNETDVRKALSAFKGIERRLEIAGKTNEITVIDDYAHNPAKMASALSSIADRFGTVHAFWRPHGFGPLAQSLADFTEVFSNHWKKSGGSIFILPVYYAGGTVTRSVESADLVDRLNSAGVPAVAVADYPALKSELETAARPGDAILGMGARDPQLPLFARHLVKEWTTT
ncbi:Mur ligase domain-containing protein [Pontiella agarivorans]|uniref:Mur ligase domain-containing protein n=1 Tax=Pontiella agarivorans TaxID=3038953 RepID=A0ABU5MUK0_9BACT|nr:Mur ligase domain-containing protein [Pontiella agarivorans]MDZ8117850.1 Mur ligase domain-containing protein [Pontiella agarivorans]